MAGKGALTACENLMPYDSPEFDFYCYFLRLDVTVQGMLALNSGILPVAAYKDYKITSTCHCAGLEMLSFVVVADCVRLQCD